MNDSDPRTLDEIDRDAHARDERAREAAVNLTVVKTPIEGLSAHIGTHIEKINRIAETLVAEFARFEATRDTLAAQHGVTVDADFGGPINSALGHWRQMQKEPGRV